MTDITIDTWLYGKMSHYGGEDRQPSYANPQVSLPAGSTLTDLLNYLEMPTDVRGITFINGELSAMPGLQPDLEHILEDGDRVAIFDQHSMWPFQYRFGVPMVEEMTEAMLDGKDQGLHHAYTGDEEDQE